MHEIYGGSIANWLKALVAIKKGSGGNNSSAPCWRQKDEVVFCENSTSISTVFLSLPVMLAIEIDDTEQQWDVPDNICLMAKRGERHGFTYELVGRIFHSPTNAHFTTRFHAKLDSGRAKAPMYDHDGLKNHGYAEKHPHADIKSYLAGLDSSIKPREGYRSRYIIYNLRGGTAAQQAFFSHQVQMLNKVHRVELATGKFESNILEHLPDHEAKLEKPGVYLLGDQVRTTWLSNTGMHRWREYAVNSMDTSSKIMLPLQFSGEAVAEAGGTAYPASPTDSLSTPLAPDVEAVVNRADYGPHPNSGASNRSGSPFSLDCRCGKIGDGLDAEINEGLEVIECDSCGSWSHIACQRGGRASTVPNTRRANFKFKCDICSGNPFGLPP